MQTVLTPTTATSINGHSLISNNLKKLKKLPFPSSWLPRSSSDEPFFSPLPSSGSGSGSGLCCRASDVFELFPTVSPEVVIREARLEDYWEVAEIHCSSFCPECYSFPLEFAQKIDRLVAMLFGKSVPNGCQKTWLVGVIRGSVDDDDTLFFLGSEDLKIRGLNKEYVVGILTVDTVADLLPRKGSLQKRRTGIAYISNVAVRERFRRKGIAKRLLAKAEDQARSWGCRAIALHCDVNNSGATKLYISQGFQCIKVPKGAKWPQARTSPDTCVNFMMKLLNTPSTV